MIVMSFANPEFLWLTPLALGIALWWGLRRGPALRYADLGLFAGLPIGRGRRARWGAAVLRGLAALALLVACAGPRELDLQYRRIPTKGIAMVLALDVSGSMATADAPWEPGSPPITRLDAARRAFRLFVEGGDAPDGTRFDPRINDPIGLVTFAALPRTDCTLTLNHSVLLGIVDRQEVKSGLDAGTNIGDAIAGAAILLERVPSDQRKVLILLSDGEHNVGREGPDAPLMPRQAAQLAVNLGIKVYTIDAGGVLPPNAAPEQVQQRRDGRQTLHDVADLTGGRSFAASSGTDLLAAYREIDALEKAEALSFQTYRRYHEYYPWCAAAAAGLLLAAHLLGRTRWRVLP